MTDIASLVIIVCLCIIAITFTAIIAVWATKSILEWFIDIRYWWEDLTHK